MDDEVVGDLPPSGETDWDLSSKTEKHSMRTLDEEWNGTAVSAEFSRGRYNRGEPGKAGAELGD